MTIKEYIDFVLSNLKKESNYVELQSENISDVFVSNNTDNEEEQDEDEDEDYSEVLTPITKVILNNSRIVLLGDPGSGKSTVVNYLMQMFCNRCIQGDVCIIPYLVKLKDIHSINDWKENISVFSTDMEFAEKLHNGNIMLFFDGLNEIPFTAYTDIVNEIKAFIEENYNAPLLITTRKYGYKKIFDLDEYQIHEFDEIAIKEYVEKRTGNSQLYKEMMKINIISSDTMNPLMLKMIIDVWEKNGILPRFRSELYSAYIDYQLDKSFPGKRSLHTALITLMEQVAFNMRNHGYISDHEDEIKSVIAEYVKEKDVDIVASLMLKSGLLNMDIVSSKFHFISFIHESFQEYLSSLYITNQFKQTGKFCVPIESYVWRDALKSVIEIISREHDDNTMVSLLDAINQHYMRCSSNIYINEYLEQLVSCSMGASKENSTCYSWIFQYLLLEMENYLNLDRESKAEDYFEIVVSSVLKFGNESLIKRLFADTRWQREWLYESIDELDEDKALPIINKELILCKAFEQSSNCIAIYTAINDLINEFGSSTSVGIKYDFISLSGRLEYAKDQIWKLLSTNDHKHLYEKTGNTKSLFHTYDVDYIKNEFEKNQTISLDSSKCLMIPRYLDCCKFYLEHICPRLIEIGATKKILRKDVISRIIYDHEIQRLLLKNPLFEAFKNEILMAFYLVPDERICHEYFEYIKSTRSDLFKEKGLSNLISTFKQCCKIDDSHKLYQLCGAVCKEGFDINEAILNCVPNIRKEDIVVFHKYKFYKESFSQIHDNIFVRDIHDGVFDEDVLTVSKTGDMYTVYTTKDIHCNRVEPNILRGDILRIGDDIIKIKKVCYREKPYLGVISKDCLTKEKVTINPKNPKVQKVFDPEQLPLYRMNELETLPENMLAQFSTHLLIDYGLIGLLPKKCKEVIDELKLYAVTYINEDIVVFANETSDITIKNNKSNKWNVGDIAYRMPYRSLGSVVLYKLYHPELFADQIFYKGDAYISSRKGVYIIDEESGRKYSCPTISGRIEGKVTFFPTVHKKRNKMLTYSAYRVNKIKL